MKNYMQLIMLTMSALILLAGCAGPVIKNRGLMPTYDYSNIEPDWIRNGEPLEYENVLWYPQDGIESLTDNEVILLTEYREVKVFVDKIDVRPYDRLYTKFGVNKYRYFEKDKPESL